MTPLRNETMNKLTGLFSSLTDTRLEVIVKEIIFNDGTIGLESELRTFSENMFIIQTHILFEFAKRHFNKDY